jgi:polysaccharide export outer membrane protein
MKNFGKFVFALLAAAFFMCSPVVHAADVQLGAGDVVRINVYNNPDLSLEARISEAGMISYPLLGEVSIKGLTPGAASKKIADLLEKGGFIRNAQVNMIVTVMQSQQVSVLGQVNRPGRFPIDGTRNLTDILALAGGVGADAGDAITLIRNNNGQSRKEVIDLLDMVRSNGTPGNVEVLPGDVIYVERAPRFYIYGEVQRPGAYRLEKNMSVLQALSVGGGLTLRGTERGVRVKRRDENGKMQTMRVEHDDLVKVDDVIYVQESLF